MPNVDAVKEVGIAGEFMTAEHTFMNMRKETFIPSLAMGGAVMGDADEAYYNNISAKIESMLNTYEQPEIHPQAVTAMEDVLKSLGFDKEYLDELAK